jgi:histidinol-phosphatase (PHP family)
MKPLFDTESKEYRDAALTALHAVAGKIPFFEVNTGAMARKYRTMPYPSLELLKEMKALDIKLILSSDCHNKFYLTAAFDECAEMMRSVGYREMYVLKKHGFEAVPLE